MLLHPTPNRFLARANFVAGSEGATSRLAQGLQHTLAMQGGPKTCTKRALVRAAMKPARSPPTARASAVLRIHPSHRLGAPPNREFQREWKTGVYSLYISRTRPTSPGDCRRTGSTSGTDAAQDHPCDPQRSFGS